MTTCIACSMSTSGVESRPDVIAVGVLAYAWTHKRTIESLCRELCTRHEDIFRSGVEAAGSPAHGFGTERN